MNERKMGKSMSTNITYCHRNIVRGLAPMLEALLPAVERVITLALGWGICVCPQHFHANSGIIPQIKPRSFPSISFPIHCSLILSINMI
jgi:hypothetical protein